MSPVRVSSAPEAKLAMKAILDDIQSGRFARDWVLENKAGQPSFKAMRANECGSFHRGSRREAPRNDALDR